MEDSKIVEQIDSKYLIKEKIGTGFSANAFLVKEKDSGENGEEYAAKVFKDENNFLFENEIKILFLLKEYKNPYIVNIIEAGKGEVIRINREKKISKYYVLEYAQYGNIFDYIYCKNGGLGELHSKVIFSKIVSGIQFCHEHDICHRDIKLENILLDKNFTPKICDFGFACINSPNLEDGYGSPGYRAPEVGRKKYDGKMADVFSLGAILIVLVTGAQGFFIADREDAAYKKICQKFFEIFWTNFAKKTNGQVLSPEFKDLFQSLVAYCPKNRLKTEDILKHPWFKELDEKYKDEEQKRIIDEEIKNFFFELEPDVKEYVKRELESKNIESELGYILKSGGENDEVFFNEDVEPKFIKESINTNYCIKIKGKLNANYFMNKLCNSIIKKFGNNNCYINADRNIFKFTADFREKEKKDEITEEFIEELKKLGLDDEKETEKEKEVFNEISIKIKLYQKDDEYFVRIVQKDGSRKNFLDKFGIIAKLIEEIIN